MMRRTKSLRRPRGHLMEAGRQPLSRSYTIAQVREAASGTR